MLVAVPQQVAAALLPLLLLLLLLHRLHGSNKQPCAPI
jgi:hypothetical protein